MGLSGVWTILMVERVAPIVSRSKKLPTYDYQCSNTDCGHRLSRIFGIREYDEMTLKDTPCANPDRRRKKCFGVYEHTFDTGSAAFALVGGGWTPKFHHSANQG
jgi:predicted nucleic acid-binding Zn ribbon protein